MDRSDVLRFVQRDRTRARTSKADFWARQYATRGASATLAASMQLHEHMRRIRPDWPTPADRDRDLHHHIEMARLYGRIAYAFRSR
ncbi:MAG: hypothetical protein VCC00_04435 [Deltaproteobacteria bacterium]